MAAGDTYEVTYDMTGVSLMDSLQENYPWDAVVCVGEFAVPTGSGGSILVQNLAVGDKVYIEKNMNQPARAVLAITITPTA